MRVLVCGSRFWKDLLAITKVLMSLPGHITIIEGGARGADSLAAIAARHLNMEVEEYKADWNKYGKSAGYMRNRQMLKEGKPQLVIAFILNSADNKGTRDMVRIAQKVGIPVQIYHG